MNMVIIIIIVNTAAIGFASEKNPPAIEMTPITILITRVPFANCLTKAPSIIFEMPIIIKDMASNDTKNRVVMSGLAKTIPESTIAIVPNTI